MRKGTVPANAHEPRPKRGAYRSTKITELVNRAMSLSHTIATLELERSRLLAEAAQLEKERDG